MYIKMPDECALAKYVHMIAEKNVNETGEGEMLGQNLPLPFSRLFYIFLPLPL
jgi:hypothetical protein